MSLAQKKLIIFTEIKEKLPVTFRVNPSLSFHDCMLVSQMLSALTALRTGLSAGAEAEAVAGEWILAAGAPITGR